jgi:glycosyltransferase involved in cell wall biosynthesis
MNGLNRLLVSLNDLDGVFEALRNLIHDSSLQQRLSEGARRLAKERFDFDRYIDRLVEYYYEILSDRQKTGKQA